MRVGIGYDIHRLAEGRDLILGGVKIPFEKGLLGDSDADVLIHAVIDALLGAAGFGDIGRVLGVGTPEVMGISSIVLLERSFKMLTEKSFRINNIDATIIAQAPRLAPYIDQIKKNIAKVLDISENQVNIKATTPQGLGPIGQEEAIAAYAILSLMESQDAQVL